MKANLSPDRLRQVLDGLHAPREFHGSWVQGEGVVMADGRRLDPARSLRVWAHSPTGFAWGYGGSGPAQLALALLLDVGLPKDLAIELHHPLLWDHVRTWISASPFSFSGSKLLRWVAEALGSLAARSQEKMNDRADCD